MAQFAKKALLLLVVFALLLTSLCACAGGTAESTSEPTAAQSGELPKTDPPTQEPAEHGNSVTVGIAQDLDSLDPHDSGVSAGTSEVLFNIFEGLVKASPDGGVTPAVASDYEVSPDGLTYTFTLREGVTFHNGAQVTIEDVLYSLKRCAGSENEGTPMIPAFSIVGDISADEEGHAVITLSEPNLEFIYSVVEAAVIPADSGDTIATSPVGTGPFKFVSYTPQDSLVVEKYDSYWGAPAYLDGVTFRVFTGESNTSAMVIALQSGALDLVIHMPSTFKSQVEDDFTVLEDTMKLVQALYINNAVKPFDDVRVRQAMYYAIDVPELIQFVCDGAGVATGTSMYPAQKRYFMPELAEAYPHDVEKARELLAEAGYPDGFEMTITAPNNYEQHIQAAEVIAEQLKAVGITARVETIEWGAWVSDVYQGRDFETSVCAISASDMSAREMLVRYASDNGKNFINFSDAEYDDVVGRAQTTLDESEQMELYKRAEEILSEQAASLWLEDLCELVVMDPKLDGFNFYCTYVLDMSTIHYK